VTTAGRVGVCGSVNMDVFGYAPRLPMPGETVLGHRLAYAPGGKGGNQAVAARRMGAEVRFAGACGRDAFGDQVVAALVADGIDVSGLERMEVETGVALIVVDDDGENQIVALPGANDHVSVPAPQPAVDVWITDGQVPPAVAAGVLDVARATGATTLCVPAPAGLLPGELVARFDVAIVNETELAALGGHRPAEIVLTLGARGARILPDGPAFPALPAHVVDTTGAGDMFAAGFLSARCRGRDLKGCLEMGAICAAEVISHFGARPEANLRELTGL